MGQRVEAAPLGQSLSVWGVGALGEIGVANGCLDEFQIRFVWQLLADQGQIVERGEAAVANHVPERVPEEGAHEGILEALEALPDEGQRLWIEFRLGEVVIVVVGEDRDWNGGRDQILDDGAWTVDLDRDGFA